MKLGNRIRLLREENRMTQKELANYLAISPSTIGMYEQNRRIPDIDTLISLSSIFNVSIDYLLSLNTTQSRENNSSNISPEDELLLSCMTTKARNLIDTFLQLDEDNQDIILGEAKKALKEQRLEEKAINTTLKKVE